MPIYAPILIHFDHLRPILDPLDHGGRAVRAGWDLQPSHKTSISRLIGKCASNGLFLYWIWMKPEAFDFDIFWYILAWSACGLSYSILLWVGDWLQQPTLPFCSVDSRWVLSVEIRCWASQVEKEAEDASDVDMTPPVSCLGQVFWYWKRIGHVGMLGCVFTWQLHSLQWCTKIRINRDGCGSMWINNGC